MATKAELETLVRELQEENHRLAERANSARDALDMAYSRQNQIEDETGLLTWVASAEPGDPVCIAGNDNGYPEGHINLSVYHDHGVITGVVISDGNGDITALVGSFPAAMVMEEIKYAGRNS